MAEKTPRRTLAAAADQAEHPVRLVQLLSQVGIQW
jgi:hypothetical protein